MKHLFIGDKAACGVMRHECPEEGVGGAGADDPPCPECQRILASAAAWWDPEYSKKAHKKER